MKGQKGITLVALVITIIVMLILVGVTLSFVLNGGLIDKAKNTAEKYNDAAGSESDGGTYKYGANNYNATELLDLF